MGQDKLIRRPPQPPSPNQPLPGVGPETWLDSLLHRAGVATGVSEQRGGDPGDFLAASAGLLGGGGIIGRLLRRAPAAADPQLAKEIVDEIEAFKARPVPGSMAEFTPVGEEPPRTYPTFPDKAKNIQLKRRGQK